MPKTRKTPKQPKKKLTPAQKAEKRRRKAEFETIFVGGKQKRVRRKEPLIEGIPADEFIRRNADPIWLHENELWEYMEPFPVAEADLHPKSNGKHQITKEMEPEIDEPF